MQLGHSIVSLLCDFRDLNHMGDLVDHPTDGRRIVMDHRLLVPLQSQCIQRTPLALGPVDAAPDLGDGELLRLGLFLLSHEVPQGLRRGCPVPGRPVLRSPWPEGPGP